MSVLLTPSANQSTMRLYALVHLIIRAILSVAAILSHRHLRLLNKRLLAILAILLLVVPMPFAEKSVVLDPALVFPNTLAILTLFVDLNVSSMRTALLRRLVSGTSVKMLVLVSVESMHSAMLSTMFHPVRACLVTKEIPSRFVIGFQKGLNLHHRQETLASPVLVVLTVNVVTKAVVPSVPVSQPTLVSHQTVGLNVWSTRNVQMIRRVSIRSVKIHVPTPVHQLQIVELEITVQFAAANLDSLEIHFLDAIQLSNNQSQLPSVLLILVILVRVDPMLAVTE